MKIVTVEQFRPRKRCQLVKITTDEGLVGWGETTLEGKLDSSWAAVQELAEYLIGRDPLRIEHHWQHIYRGAFYRGGPVLLTALSGIEQALWDLAGKYFNAPVYQLLGGATRDRIKVYAWWSIYADEQAARRELEALLKKGYRAFKAEPDGKWQAYETPKRIDEFVRKAYLMREWVGEEVDLSFDFHGKMTPALAITLCREIESMRPQFVEEPVPQENVEALALVARSTRIPLATGERLVTRWGFREVIEKQAAAFLQPDLSHAGGIAETKKIAALAETYYMHLAPHCAIGPVAFAACLQLDASIPNFLIQEQGDLCLGDGLLRRNWVVQDGYIALPTGPGLGIEVDEEAVQKTYAGSFEIDTWYHDQDGSVADW
jgi:galactonate dehydratase